MICLPMFGFVYDRLSYSMNSQNSGLVRVSQSTGALIIDFNTAFSDVQLHLFVVVNEICTVHMVGGMIGSLKTEHHFINYLYWETQTHTLSPSKTQTVGYILQTIGLLFKENV